MERPRPHSTVNFHWTDHVAPCWPVDVLCSTALQQRPELFRLVLTAREALCLLPFQPPHSSVTKKPFPCKLQLLASLRTTVKPFFLHQIRLHLQAPDPNSKYQFRRRPSRRADSVLFTTVLSSRAFDRDHPRFTMGDFNGFGGSDEENAEIRRLNSEIVSSFTI